MTPNKARILDGAAERKTTLKSQQWRKKDVLLILMVVCSGSKGGDALQPRHLQETTTTIKATSKQKEGLCVWQVMMLWDFVRKLLETHEPNLSTWAWGKEDLNNFSNILQCCCALQFLDYDKQITIAFHLRKDFPMLTKFELVVFVGLTILNWFTHDWGLTEI